MRLLALAVICWLCLVHRARARVSRWVDTLGDRLEVIEPVEAMTLWWVESVHAEREGVRAGTYTPRHSWETAQRPDHSNLDEWEWSIRWRTRWAEWDTQFWPTFSSESGAWATVDSTTCNASYDWGNPLLFGAPFTTDDDPMLTGKYVKDLAYLG